MRPIDADALMDAFRAYMVDRYDREKCLYEENCKTCENSCLWRKIVSAAPTVNADIMGAFQRNRAVPGMAETAEGGCVMEKVKAVHLCGTEKWMNLLHWMNNAVPQVFCVRCRDEKEAKNTAHRIQDVITGHPTWFEMFVTRRKAEVYVIKIRFAQKVVIKRE